MIIKKIRLQNITTHVDTTIEFYNGVNILMGQNGTGKSTVLTMIGYVLFNHLPGRSQDIYVRIGAKQKYGMVTLWFIGNDRKDYCIKRAIGKTNNRIEVFIGEKETKHQKINTVTNLIEFLHTVIGVQNFSLDTIFENAIGVQQGSFTAPFLLSPAKRKNVFRPLLKVEIYDQIWKQYRKINSQFKDRINDKKMLISKLEGQLQNKDEVKEDILNLETKLQQDNKEWTQKKELLTEINNKYLKLKEIKEKLDKAKKDFDTLDLKIESKKETIKKLENNIDEAKKAMNLCKKTKDDFETFNKYSKIQGELQRKNHTRSNLEKRRNELSEKIEVYTAQIKEISRNIEEIKNQNEYYEKLTQKNNQAKVLTDEIQKYQNKKTKLATQEEEWNNLKQENIPIIENMKEIQKELLILPQLEKEIKKIEEFQKSKLNISNKIATHNARIQDLQENLAEVKDGVCPLCKQEFHEVGKTLEESFLEELKEKRDELRKLQKRMDDIENKITNLKQKESHIDVLRNKEAKFKELKNNLTKNKKRIKELEELLSHKEDVEKYLTAAEKKKKELEPKIQEFHILHNKFTKELPRFETNLKEKQKKIKKYRLDLAPIQEKLNALKDIPKKIQDTQEKLEKTRKNHDIYQSNIAISQKFPTYKSEHKTSKEKLEELEQKIILKKRELQQFKANFDETEFKTIEEQRTNLHKENSLLEGEIKQKESNLNKLKLKLQELLKLDKELTQKTKELEKMQLIDNFSHTIRNWFKESEPKITAALMNEINETGSDIFRRIKDEAAVRLEWKNDYDVLVFNSQFPPRSFEQLSGGEQMAVALSIRLAILKVLTSIDFAFFDEPTTNLDKEKRSNLAQCIERIKGFKQLFIISHDDTFEENSDHVIRFEKDEDEITTVNYLGQFLE